MQHSTTQNNQNWIVFCSRFVVKLISFTCYKSTSIIFLDHLWNVEDLKSHTKESQFTAIVDRLFQFRRRLSTVPGRKVVRDVEFVMFVLRGPRRHRNILLVAVYAYPLSMSRILLRTLRPDRFSLTLRKRPLAEPLHRIIGGPSTALVLA